MRGLDRIGNKLWKVLGSPSATINLGERNYHIPRIQVNKFYKPSYQSEPWLVNILKSIHQFRKINSFIDVGCNIGQTLLKIKSINPLVVYVGFEPNPTCCSFTQNIIDYNNLSECTVIPCGLSNKADLAKLNIDRQHDLFDSSASIVEGFRRLDYNTFQFVPVFRLDDVVDKLQVSGIDLIKIDIEGAELEAIQGMMASLERNKPIVIMEVLPAYEISNQFRVTRQKQLARLMKSLSYRIYHIKKDKMDPLFKEVEEFPIHKTVNESDYLLLPAGINLKELGLKPR